MPQLPTIALLGATGHTGRALLEQALERGHHVRALVRDPSKLNTHDNLTLIQGDASSAEDLASLLQGAHTVINCLGLPHHSTSRLVSEVTTQLLELNPQHQVDRLLNMSNTGVDDTGSWIGRRVVIPLFLRWLRPIIEDKQRAEDALRQHPDLRWASIRFPNIVDGPARPVRTSPHGKDLSWSITTHSAATFLLDQVTQDTWMGQMPCVSN